VLTGVGLAAGSVLFAGAPLGLKAAYDVGSTAYSMKTAYDALSAPKGISLKDQEGNVISGMEIATLDMLEEQLYGKQPAPPSSSTPDEGGDDAPKKKKLIRAAANGTTLAVADSDDLTRKDLRRARRQITRFA